ncbi:MAG: hypothetical protein ABID71_02825 [Chloroflexota bacterium]
MTQEIGQEVEATEVETPPEPEAKQEYDLHIKVPAEMRQKLRDCAELAHKMGDIPKPDLVDLMNLFIGWGMAIQKKKWLDRVGYR